MPQTLSASEIETLYDSHADAVAGFLRSLTGAEADAKDLLQELFCRIASGRLPLKGVRAVRGYLLQTARRMFLDQVRRREVRDRYDRESFPSEIFAPAGDADEQAFREALAAALFDLPEEQRSVVYLHLWAEQTFAEIAQLLETPLNTVTGRYRYGIQKLRAKLQPLYQEIL